MDEVKTPDIKSLTVRVINVGGTPSLIFERFDVSRLGLKSGMVVNIRITKVTRAAAMFPKDVMFTNELKSYTEHTLRMAIFQNYAIPLGLEDQDLVNIDILHIDPPQKQKKGTTSSE